MNDTKHKDGSKCNELISILQVYLGKSVNFTNIF